MGRYDTTDRPREEGLPRVPVLSRAILRHPSSEKTHLADRDKIVMVQQRLDQIAPGTSTSVGLPLEQG